MYVNKLHTLQKATACAHALKEEVLVENDHQLTNYMKYPSQWYKLTKIKCKNAIKEKDNSKVYIAETHFSWSITGVLP